MSGQSHLEAASSACCVHSPELTVLDLADAGAPMRALLPVLRSGSRAGLAVSLLRRPHLRGIFRLESTTLTIAVLAPVVAQARDLGAAETWRDLATRIRRTVGHAPPASQSAELHQ
jgi:hypothetical protein